MATASKKRGAAATPPTGAASCCLDVLKSMIPALRPEQQNSISTADRLELLLESWSKVIAPHDGGGKYEPRLSPVAAACRPDNRTRFLKNQASHR